MYPTNTTLIHEPNSGLLATLQRDQELGQLVGLNGLFPLYGFPEGSAWLL